MAEPYIRSISLINMSLARIHPRVLNQWRRKCGWSLFGKLKLTCCSFHLAWCLLRTKSTHLPKCLPFCWWKENPLFPIRSFIIIINNNNKWAELSILGKTLTELLIRSEAHQLNSMLSGLVIVDCVNSCNQTIVLQGGRKKSNWEEMRLAQVFLI